MEGTLDIGQSPDAMATTAEPECAFLEVQGQCDLTLAVMETKHGTCLALVAGGGTPAGLSHLLPVGEIADMEVFAADVDVAIVVQANATTFLTNAVVEVH